MACTCIVQLSIFFCNLCTSMELFSLVPTDFLVISANNAEIVGRVYEEFGRLVTLILFLDSLKYLS